MEVEGKGDNSLIILPSLEDYETFAQSYLSPANIYGFVHGICSHPKIFHFNKILHNEKFILIAKDFQDLLLIMNIFAYGDIKDLNAANKLAVLTLNSDEILKLKYLTILHVAETNKKLYFETVKNEIYFEDTKDLENIFIEMIYLGMLRGYINQALNYFYTEYAICRDIKENDISIICEKFKIWKNKNVILLKEIDEELAFINSLHQLQIKHKEDLKTKILKNIQLLKSTKHEEKSNKPNFKEYLNASSRQETSHLPTYSSAKSIFSTPTNAFNSTTHHSNKISVRRKVEELSDTNKHYLKIGSNVLKTSTTLLNSFVSNGSANFANIAGNVLRSGSISPSPRNLTSSPSTTNDPKRSESPFKTVPSSQQRVTTIGNSSFYNSSQQAPNHTATMLQEELDDFIESDESREPDTNNYNYAIENEDTLLMEDDIDLPNNENRDHNILLSEDMDMPSSSSLNHFGPVSSTSTSTTMLQPDQSQESSVSTNQNSPSSTNPARISKMRSGFRENAAKFFHR